MLSNNKARWFFFQITALFVIAFLVFHLWGNLLQNINDRGIQVGFGFLSSEAGFSIAESLIDYDESSSYLDAFYVGITNTLYVGFVAIIFSSILGLIVGIANFSSNFLVRKFANIYIELFRNIPILLQILFWHNLMLNVLPSVRQSWSAFDGLFINLRGIYFPKPTDISDFVLLNLLITIVIIALIYLKNYSNKIKYALTLLPIAGYFLLGGISFELPILKGFNFQGGFNISPEFFALAFALSVYTATYIAEAIRSGVESVPIGQTESAQALGLTKSQTLKVVVLPQALRVAVPPIISQYLNVIKNSSLAVAIGYPDLVNVFTGTTLNQVGQALEIIAMTMLVYLLISLVISLILNIVNARLKIIER